MRYEAASCADPDDEDISLVDELVAALRGILPYMEGPVPRELPYGVILRARAALDRAQCHGSE